jgi:hypothetical protein
VFESQQCLSKVGVVQYDYFYQGTLVDQKTVNVITKEQFESLGLAPAQVVAQQEPPPPPPQPQHTGTWVE